MPFLDCLYVCTAHNFYNLSVFLRFLPYYYLQCAYLYLSQFLKSSTLLVCCSLRNHLSLSVCLFICPPLKHIPSVWQVFSIPLPPFTVFSFVFMTLLSIYFVPVNLNILCLGQGRSSARAHKTNVNFRSFAFTRSLLLLQRIVVSVLVSSQKIFAATLN